MRWGRGHSLLGLALALGLLASCGVSDQLLAGRGDYTAYREVRLAGTQLKRLSSSHRYLRENPDGRFRAEVQAWFARAEPRFFQQAHDRPSLLKAYLVAMPDGPHAKAAALRLSEFALLKQYAAARAQREEARLREIEGALARADTERAEVVRLLTELTRSMAHVRSFGGPVAELGEERLARFGLQPLAAHCQPSHCAATLSSRYAVPDRGVLTPRPLPLTVRVELKKGNVSRVVLASPQLFNRLTEAVDRVAVAEDPGARIDALARSAQVLGNALEEALPASRCEKQPVATAVLVRECDGVRLEMRAAIEPEVDDRIEVFPAKATKGSSRKKQGASP
ncbi:MAG TPA: hypothetical protein VER33_17280 [Polyangiaceae bacterium]|nr:hypothetical protein [Polyangiaceae bacterium]